jgi:hypothetical protein
MALLGKVLYEHFLSKVRDEVSENNCLLTVASVITNAALFEHIAISESCAMIFLTRATAHTLAIA